MDINLFPLDRVEFNGIAIPLGADNVIVEAVIGPGETFGTRRYYYHNELAIDYDANNTVEFIEFLGGVDGTLKPVIYGVSAFDTDAEELARLLQKHNGGTFADEEHGHAYQFRNISVGVYRELTPADVAEMIEEMKADGIPAENDPDLEADKRRAEHWSAIGMGVAGYYQ